MRISDWSSDVCSSDLVPLPGALALPRLIVTRTTPLPSTYLIGPPTACVRLNPFDSDQRMRPDALLGTSSAREPMRSKRPSLPTNRSEEHTSELQSLMRISYAVFCLKKQPNHHNTKTIANIPHH